MPRLQEKSEKKTQTTMERSLESGYLKLTIGPMFSGKSTSLISQTTRYRDLKCKCLIINHSSDIRQTQTTTRSLTLHSSTKFTIPEDIDILSTDDLSKVDITGYKCIAVDEMQFFPSLDPCIDWVDNHGCHVFLSGLNGSSERNLMGAVAKILPHCDDISIIKACCLRCHSNRGVLTDAIFTHCTVQKDSEVAIGGSDMYQPVCRSCYLELNSPSH